MKQVLNAFLKLILFAIVISGTAQTMALAKSTIRISSTIGPIEAGIVPLLAQTYEKKTDVTISYEGAGTGATLEKAKKGGFDMVIVHARKLEDQFIADGYGVDRRDIMYNDFVILGPKNDPAKVAGQTDAAKALQQIAKAESLFVTRGDNSGTHVKEMQIWEKAQLKPEGKWYDVFAEGSKGNKATTWYADKNQAYVLMDRATYLTLKNEISLVPLVENDKILLNYIAAILIDPKKFPETQHQQALDFMNWLVDDEAQEIIKNFEVAKYGAPLFFPNSEQWNSKHTK